MHNPLRSEAEMFRLVVIVGIGAAAVIALALLTEPEYGMVLAALLAGLGIGLAWRGARGSERGTAEVASGDGSAHRVLVVANQTVGGEALLDEIGNRCRGRSCELMVTVPALPGSRLDYWASATDDAVDEARQRLAESLAAIESLGVQARGEVGDQDPNVAMGDALREFPADELIISTHPVAKSKWLERGVVARAREEVNLPVTHVVVDLEAERARV
jgi:GABA permease